MISTTGDQTGEGLQLAPCELEIREIIFRPSKDFCRYREAGQYEHPLFCDVFLYCSVGGSRADVKFYQSLLFYNTVLGVCDDWKSIFRFFVCRVKCKELMIQIYMISLVFTYYTDIVYETCILKRFC